MTRCSVCLVALVTLFVSTSALAATPTLTNGTLVAKKLEAHYNGAAYKRRLDASNPGTRLVNRVLCAPTSFSVQCTARMRVQRETDRRWIIARAQWELEKLSARRAKLRWMLSGPSLFESDYEIVAPRDFGLLRF